MFLKFTIKQINFAERQHTHVIKLTTKYKIPDFGTLLLGQIHANAELILQHSKTKKRSLFQKKGWQNTEILGFKVSRIHEILSDLENMSGDLETRVFKLAASGKYVVQRLPLLYAEQPFYPRRITNLSACDSMRRRIALDKIRSTFFLNEDINKCLCSIPTADGCRSRKVDA